MKVYGLTGGIACGKSAAATLLAQNDIHVIDCDKIARQVVEKGTWGWQRVRRTFRDEDVFRPDGSLDRDKMGSRIFGDAAARKRLNAALHLPILAETVRQVVCSWLSCKSLVVVDMPLLFEVGAWRYTSGNIVVTCSPSTQEQRLCKRDNISAEAAQLRLDAQMPLEEKARLATHVVDNDTSFSGLEVQVRELSASLKSSSLWHGVLLGPISLAVLGTTAFCAIFLRLVV